MEKNKSFESIDYYDHQMRSCNLTSLTRYKWLTQFAFNFTLGINKLSKTSAIDSVKTEKNDFYGNVSEKLRNRILREFKNNHKIKYNDPIPIPVINTHDVSESIFKEWRFKVNMPLVIKGLVKDSNACKNWSKDWLAENFGLQMVQCIPPASSTEDRTKAKLKEISLKDFFTNDKYENYYINNHHSVFNTNDFYKNCSGKKVEEVRGSKCLIDQWFISRSKQTGSALHCANGDNLFLNIKGRKEWHFIHPSYSAILSPLMSKYAVYAISDIENSLLENWESIYKSHPILEYVPIYKVVLKEGDVLFNPSWWWHSVRNLEPFTIGCAARFRAPKTINNSAFSLCQIIEAIKYPKKSVIPQFLSMLIKRKVSKNFIGSIHSKN
jgi:hypothetical protein